MKLIPDKYMSNDSAFLHYDAFAIICCELVSHKDCENWHHCVGAGGSLETANLKDIVFHVRNPSQETALKRFDFLYRCHNQKKRR